MIPQTPENNSRMPPWLKTAIAVSVSAAILSYYLAGQDWRKLYHAALNADLFIAVLAVFIPQVIYWFFEIWITDRHFTWFHEPFPWKIYLWVRGAMYLLMLVNTVIAGGGILLYLQRKTGASWKKLLGIMMFRAALGVWGMTIIIIPVTLAMHYYDVFKVTGFDPYLWWGGLLISVGAFIESCIGWRYGKFLGVSRLIVRDSKSDFWAAFRMATPGQWVMTVLWGVVPMVFMVGGFWLFAYAFDVRIPVLHYIATSLIVMAISDLPIAFAGFGTTTMAWSLFYSDFGSAENITSLTILLPFVRVAARSLIGLVSLKPAFQEMADMIPASGGMKAPGSTG